jgi:hypothetical protein
MRQWPQFPEAAVYVFDVRLSHPCTIVFQRPDMRQYFLVLDPGVLAGFRLPPKLNQDFFYRLFALSVLVKFHFKHNGVIPLPFMSL